MKKQLMVGAVLGTVLFLVTGCGTFTVLGNDDTLSEEIIVEKDKAKELEVELNLGVGEMNITGGSDEWITGEIEYTDKKFKPELSYDLDGDTGEILVEQEKKINVYFGRNNEKNVWDLQLNDEVPIRLEVNSGATDTNLTLSGLQLSELSVNAGVGDIDVDLSGEWKESFDVTLETGVGETTVILPKGVGVKVKSEEGVGSSNYEGLISQGDGVYVNELYEEADVMINIMAETGVGEITFKEEN